MMISSGGNGCAPATCARIPDRRNHLINNREPSIGTREGSDQAKSGNAGRISNLTFGIPITIVNLPGESSALFPRYALCPGEDCVALSIECECGVLSKVCCARRGDRLRCRALVIDLTFRLPSGQNAVRCLR